MYDQDLDTKTKPCLSLHLEGTDVVVVTETLYQCLLVTDNAFGYSE